jgi:hypothetical protein
MRKLAEILSSQGRTNLFLDPVSLDCLCHLTRYAIFKTVLPSEVRTRVEHLHVKVSNRRAIWKVQIGI